MRFCDKLRELKLASGLSEAKLAEQSGVKLGALHTYILGNREPPFAAVVKLARALGVGVEAFAGCVEDGPAASKSKPAHKPKATARKPAKPRPKPKK